MRFRCLPLSMTLLGLTLASCNTWSPAVRSANEDVQKLTQTADEMREKAKTPRKPLDMSSIQMSDDYYLGSISHKKSDGNLLPVDVEQGGVTLTTGQAMNIYEIADLITKATGISVSVSDDVTGNGQSNRMQNNNGGGRATAGNESMQRGKMHVNHMGPLSTFLDHVSGYYNIGWSYVGGSIHFFKNATRTFSVAALPTQMQSSASMSAGASGSGGGSGSGSGSGGSGTLSTSITTQLDFWKDFQESIGTIVGTAGTYLVNKTAGTVTVTAPYDVLDSVSDYIQYVNKVLLRQVVIQVEVYTLTLGADDAFNFTPVIAWKDKNGALGFGGNNASLSANAGAGLVLPKLALDAGAGIIGTVTNGRMQGTSGLLSMNDKQTNATLVTRASLTTMSGQPVPLQVGRSQDYVSKVGTTSDISSTTTTVTTSTVTSGTSINILPRVMDDGKVLLSYAINLSDVPNFSDYEIGGTNPQRIQLLDVSQKSFIQQALIGSGSTLVLSGFESMSGQNNQNGVGSSSFSLLGGGYDLKKNRIITVIAITPIVLDNDDTAVRMRAKGQQ